MQRKSRYIAQLSLVLFSVPFFAQAACTANGYTVVFVNGIFNTKEQAQDSTKELGKYLGKTFNSESVSVSTGYNPSHFAGLGDLIQVAAQSFGASVSSFDRDTILLQIHPEVTTRKVFLVGHSQGTLYTNDIYGYLTTQGEEPKSAVGVYNVATPASYVAGGGTYLTSDSDYIIKDYAAYAKTVGALPPLPGNAYLGPGAAVGNGHSFTDIYLTYAGEHMVQNIQQGLSRLTAEEGTAAEGCFTPPANGLGYKTKQVLFAVADPAATGIKVAAVTGWNGASMAVGGVKSGLAAAGSFFGTVADAVTPKPRTANLPGSHDVVGAVYGSSVTEENLREFGLLEDQGGAAALAVADGGEVKGEQTEKQQEPPAPTAPPVPQALDVPPLYSVGGGGSPGFGGGGGSPAAAAITTEDSSADATSTATSTPSESAASSTPEAVVPDGTPPSVATVAINGAVLAPMAPFADTPVATTTTTWSTVVTFDEDMSVAPNVKDGTESFDFANGTEQAVNDCSDGDAKTFCFTYLPPPNIEAAVYWFFRVAGAQDISGETLASTTYRFIVDTAGPALTLDAPAVSSTLPTVSGTSSFTSAAITLLLNNSLYSFNSPDGLWSFAVQAGSELAEGVYPIIATSTDQYNNQVVYNWTLAVDLTAPVLGITSGPAEGDSVASTSPVSFEFSATDATALAYACAVDAGAQFVCTSPYESLLAPGARAFAVTATDAAGNAVSATRNFTVLP